MALTFDVVIFWVCIMDTSDIPNKYICMGEYL